MGNQLCSCEKNDHGHVPIQCEVVKQKKQLKTLQTEQAEKLEEKTKEYKEKAASKYDSLRKSGIEFADQAKAKAEQAKAKALEAQALAEEQVKRAKAFADDPKAAILAEVQQLLTEEQKVQLQTIQEAANDPSAFSKLELALSALPDSDPKKAEGKMLLDKAKAF